MVVLVLEVGGGVEVSWVERTNGPGRLVGLARVGWPGGTGMWGWRFRTEYAFVKNRHKLGRCQQRTRESIVEEAGIVGCLGQVGRKKEGGDGGKCASSNDF
jgi:hypothetical protein